MVSTRFLFTVMPLSGALAQAWGNWQEPDVTVTTTVQKTKYVCPCDSTSSAWESWMTSSSTMPYQQWSSTTSATWEKPATWSNVPGSMSTPSVATWTQWVSSGTPTFSATWSSWQSSATPSSSSYGSWSNWQSSSSMTTSTTSSSSMMTTSTVPVVWGNWQGGVVVDPTLTSTSSTTSSTSSSTSSSTTTSSTTSTSTSTSTSTTTMSMTTTTTSSTTTTTTTTSSTTTTTLLPVPTTIYFTVSALVNPFATGTTGTLVLSGPFNEEYLTFGTGTASILAIDSQFYLRDPATGQYANVAPGYTDQLYFSSFDAINNFGYSRVQCQIAAGTLLCAAGLDATTSAGLNGLNLIFNLDAQGDLYLSQTVPVGNAPVVLTVNQI